MPNRFAATCIHCRQLVPPGMGWVRFDGTAWVVRHPWGVCRSVAYIQYVSLDSPVWRQKRSLRLAYAQHRCEWRSFWSGRCPLVHDLECHHRHYRTLGAERLQDLIVLCPRHHAIADRRRRFWGSWPWIGRPVWRRARPANERARVRHEG